MGPLQEVCGPLKSMLDVVAGDARRDGGGQATLFQVGHHRLGLEVVGEVAPVAQHALRPQRGGSDQRDLEAVGGGLQLGEQHVAVDLVDVEDRLLRGWRTVRGR